MVFGVVGLVAYRSYKSRSETPPPCTDCADQPYTFAIIADYPYDATQLQNFPAVARQINADSDVQFTAHLGDIKDDGDCSKAYYERIRTEFDRFTQPFVYTPGDNEWADCYRPANGSYNPLERLKVLRQVFFAHPGRTLGAEPMTVVSQDDLGYPENVRFTRAKVSFGAFHAVGPRNGLFVWTGETAPTPKERAEFTSRTAAAVRLIKDTFSSARDEDARAVVLFTQADMFSPERSDADEIAYRPIVQALAAQAADFDGPVYLFDGDTHEYRTDQPLKAGEKWLRLYDVAGPVDNLTRVTLDGDENATNYLRVTIRPYFSRVLSWDRIEFTSR